MTIICFIAGVAVGLVTAGICMINTKNYYDKKSIELQALVDEELVKVQELTKSFAELKTFINKRGK